jgi:ABC-type transport system involved in cytochrome c biogenesis permease subunit
MAPPSDRHRDTRSPVGDAMAWAARIMAVGIVMFMPAVAGTWLDSHMGTAFLGMAGLVVGFVLGLSWLLQLSGRKRP